jgi:uncharacterized membrane protein YebE (DUF533 family)
MTDWFDVDIPIDAAAAALIAEGMRTVARADGMIHQRELALIATFESAVPKEQTPRPDALGTDALKSVYVRSLVMVALADGRISDSEHAAILGLAADQGLDAAMVEGEILSVKRRFLSVFAGVNVFRDAVVRVARDLGLSESELDALAQEA